MLPDGLERLKFPQQIYNIASQQLWITNAVCQLQFHNSIKGSAEKSQKNAFIVERSKNCRVDAAQWFWKKMRHSQPQKEDVKQWKDIL